MPKRISILIRALFHRGEEILRGCAKPAALRPDFGTLGALIALRLLFGAAPSFSAEADQSAGVQATVGDNGLQSLTWRGQNFLAHRATEQLSIIDSAYFTGADGATRGYGGAQDSLDKEAFIIKNAVRSATPGQASFQHIYRAGATDSLTVKVTYTPLDARTLKIDAAVINNSRTSKLMRVTFSGVFLNLILPGPADQYGGHLPMDIGPMNQWARGPVAFLSGAWGSLALWMGNYGGTQDLFTFYDSAGQREFNFILSSDSQSSANQIYTEPIEPSGTRVLTTYLRFGAPSDHAVSLAPEAYDLMRQAYPGLIRWTDKRPIARLFISGQPSLTNPRGYFSLGALDMTDKAQFAAQMRAWTRNTLHLMNEMRPKPQAVLLWDLEGQEFSHTFTYVGDPRRLADLAPEMDAVADEMFAAFRDAGYKIGMTLRPSSFAVGATLPASCQEDVNRGFSKSFPATSQDVFIKIDAIPPHRGYECRAPNTWAPAGPRFPNYQTQYNDENITYAILAEKVAYAQKRWGATMFYVDSTVNTRGDPMSVKVFRRLQEKFPDTLFMPENANYYYYGATAVYGQGNMGAFDVPAEAKEMYPDAFRVLQVSDTINHNDPDVYAKLVQSVRNGNILMVNGWTSDPKNAVVLRAYRDGGFQSQR